MFKVRGATVYPSEVEHALRSIDGVRGVWATNVVGSQGNQIGAAVVCDTATMTVGTVRHSAKALLSSFKVPTVWLLTDEDSLIPRLASGKVDVTGLRTLLTAATPPPTDGDRP
jgi:acyl-CoA synthetase (AMP-forming)/AMP-acid ligase II